MSTRIFLPRQSRFSSKTPNKPSKKAIKQTQDATSNSVNSSNSTTKPPFRQDTSRFPFIRQSSLKSTNNLHIPENKIFLPLSHSKSKVLFPPLAGGFLGSPSRRFQPLPGPPERAQPRAGPAGEPRALFSLFNVDFAFFRAKSVEKRRKWRNRQLNRRARRSTSRTSASTGRRCARRSCGDG